MRPTKPDAPIHLADRSRKTGVRCNAGARWLSSVVRSVKGPRRVTCRRCLASMARLTA